MPFPNYWASPWLPSQTTLWTLSWEYLSVLLPLSFIPATGSFSVLGHAASLYFSARLISYGSSGLSAWSSAEHLVRIVTVSGKVDDEFPDYLCLDFCFICFLPCYCYIVIEFFGLSLCALFFHPGNIFRKFSLIPWIGHWNHETRFYCVYSIAQFWGNSNQSFSSLVFTCEHMHTEWWRAQPAC